MKTQIIRKFGGAIIGTLTTDSNGKITVRKFGGPILGYYDPKTDMVRKFGGVLVGKGRELLITLFDTI